MKSRGGFIQDYKCKTVCTEYQIIISADVSQKENDFYQLEPMLEQTTTNLRKSWIKKNIETLSANAGYFRENLAFKYIETKRSKVVVMHKKHL